MQFFDSTNAMLICAYCAIIQVIVLWSAVTDTTGLWDFSLMSDVIYLFDIIMLIGIWLGAAYVFWRYEGDKVKAFGVFMSVVGLVILLDRLVCIVAEYANNYKDVNMDAFLEYVLLYAIIIALGLYLINMGMKIYNQKEIWNGNRILILVFMILFIITRALQLIVNSYDITDFIDVESGIFLCVFIVGALIDEDVKEGMGGKVREDEDFDFLK